MQLLNHNVLESDSQLISSMDLQSDMAVPSDIALPVCLVIERPFAIIFCGINAVKSGAKL